MKYSKEKLIELSKQYFLENENIQTMYATSDNQFFFPEAKSYASSHSRSNNVETYIITRAEAIKVIAPIAEEIAPTVEEIEPIAEIKPTVNKRPVARKRK
jgi:hypothetical protein